MIRRALFASSIPADGPVLGASVPRTQMAPSSRWGRNSEPMSPPKPRNNMTSTSAPPAITEAGKGNLPSHGMEETAFHSLQSEDGEIRGDDDKNGEENRTLDFVGGVGDDLHQRAMFIHVRLDVAKNVLDHHDSAVDDHAEIESAQRQQVRGNVVQVQQDGGK